jgi:hypothetical protein
MFVNASRVRQICLSLFIIVIALVVALRPQTSERVIRYTGLFLQLLGIGTVIWGISETRAFFGLPSFADKTKSWLRRVFSFRKNYVLTADSGIVSTRFDKARGYKPYTPEPNSTIEARVELLERNIEFIHERISRNEKEMDKEFRNVEEALKKEEQARLLAEKACHEKLLAMGTGGVHISFIGACFLIIGVILSTAGIEIAEFIK